MDSFIHRIDRGGLATTTAGHGKDIRLATVAAKPRSQHTARVSPALQHRGACAIAKEHAGVAIFPVDDGGKFFGANDQYVLICAVVDKLPADLQRVQEAGAGCLQIERRRPGRAQFLLHDAGRGGKGHVGRNGGDND